jgi:hypothetical protein
MTGVVASHRTEETGVAPPWGVNPPRVVTLPGRCPSLLGQCVVAVSEGT